MKEITCPVCNKKVIAGGNSRFCSRDCWYSANYGKFGWGEISCKFNGGVNCGIEECEKCGWNPEVEQRRKEALRKRYADEN